MKCFHMFISIETNIEQLKDAIGPHTFVEEMKIQSKSVPGKTSFASLIFLVCLPSLQFNEDWI